MSPSDDQRSLRATVRRSTGATRHYEGRLAENQEVFEQLRELGPVAAVMIEMRDDGIYLLYLDAASECLTDTWHGSIESAKEQANFEFLIAEEDWTEV